MEKVPSAPPLAVVVESELVPILSTEQNYASVDAAPIDVANSSESLPVTRSGDVVNNDTTLFLVRRCLTFLGFLGLIELLLALISSTYLDFSILLLIVITTAGLSTLRGWICLPSEHQGYNDYRSRGIMLLVIGLIISMISAALNKEYSTLEACVATIDSGNYRYYGDRDYYNSALRCVSRLYGGDWKAIGDCACVNSKLSCVAFEDTTRCQPYLNTFPSIIAAMYIVGMVHALIALIFVVMYICFVTPHSVPFVAPASTPAVVLPASVRTTTFPNSSIDTTANYYPGGYLPRQDNDYSFYHHHHDLPIWESHHNGHHYNPHHSLFSSHGSGHHTLFGHHSSHHDSHHDSHYDSHHDSHHDW